MHYRNPNLDKKQTWNRKATYWRVRHGLRLTTGDGCFSHWAQRSC